MRFNFYETPDYTEVLQRSYDKINRAYDEREELEKQNDQVRIQESGNAIKLINAIAEFSPKATKLAKAYKVKQQKRQRKNYLKSELAKRSIAEQKLVFDSFEKNKNVLTDEYKATWMVANKIKDEGKYKAAVDLVNNTNWKKVKFGVKEALFKNHLLTYDEQFRKFAGDTRDLTSSALSSKLAEFNSIHFDNEVVPSGDKFLEDLEAYQQQRTAALMAKQNELDVKEAEATWDAERKLELQKTFQFDNNEEGRATFNTNVMQYMERVQAEKGFDTLGEAYQDTAETLLEMVKERKIEPHIARKFESLFILHKGKKGTPQQLLLESHEKWLNAANWQKDLQDAEKEYYEEEAEEADNYEKSFIASIKEEKKNNGGTFTNERLAQKIREEWDVDKYGVPPSTVTDFATDEVKLDELTVPYLNNLWNKGLLTEDDVFTLNSAELRNTWLPRVGEVGPNGVTDTDLASAKAHAVRYANEVGKNKGLKQGDISVATGNIERNTEIFFPGIFAREMETANNAVEAYNAALKIVDQKIESGAWDTLQAITSDVNQRKRDLTGAQLQLENNINVLDTEIIYGSESSLEEAASLHNKNIAHPFYVQLSKTLKVDGKRLHPLKIQEMQLEVRSELLGANKPVKSKVLQAWEAMPETSKELLSAYQTPSRLIRAKVEAFYGVGDNVADGVIDYNDPAISSIADEILANKDGLYSEFEVEETIFDPPKIKELSNRQKLVRKRSQYSDGVAAEKMKEFLGGLVQFPGEFVQDVFATEAAAFDYIGKAIEEREQEVKEQRNRFPKKNRKRY